MLFSDLPMGTEEYYIFITPDNKTITSDDYSSLDGKRIGVNKGSIQSELFSRWAEQHGVKADLVELTTTEVESLEILEAGQLDAYITLNAYGDPERLVPVCNIGSRLAMPLFLIGLILAYTAPAMGEWLMLFGIGAYSLAVFFQLVTLPVEFNASRRAMRCLAGSGTMSDEELRGARRVLSAAAMTYVAALAVGLLSVLRLLLIAGSYSRRR